MNQELLQRGCEAAGLLRLEDGRWALLNVDEEGGPASGYLWAWHEDDPALPAVVAAMLVERGRKELPLGPFLNSFEAEVDVYSDSATRITAALALLEDKP